MRFRSLLLAVFSLFTVALAGCGGGSDGLNGAVTVTVAATGTEIKATAQYTNPTVTNLIGQPIKFSFRVGNGEYQDLGTYHTNNSGIVSVSFHPAAFTGTQTVTVKVEADKLTDFASVSLSGVAMTLTPIPAVDFAVTSDQANTSTEIPIPSQAGFLTVNDPFDTSSTHLFKITATVAPTSAGATVTFADTGTNTTTIVATGTGDFPGATLTMTSPAASNTISVTVTWTVTELTVVNNQAVPLAGGLTGNTTTAVSLTTNAPVTTP
ncbi:hypothetical protein LPW11_17370 [Geomonas sp. RF6]|uniref:hypothetical protein n=1 Tax=Geomonas sp. RF6 TaxID=2897342 RepID=UPI001E481D45|nr:hypothetical protein [Geomonas sp. RF6]UFS69652.1 hypothetical protein LPW11_17370 [Geomonas sp. RF6]